MSKSRKSDLYYLIKSMDKAEKRNFKVFAQRQGELGKLKFVRLFDIIDKMKSYDESVITFKMSDLSSSKLINLKRHLYKVILRSLRLIHDKKKSDIWLREQIDYAKILYGKGLYFQSLTLLDKIVPIAKETSETFLIAEILEFQKYIESRHITRSRRVKDKVESLIDESTRYSDIITNTVSLSNLALKIQGYYIKYGVAKNKQDSEVVIDYFKSNLPQYDINKLGFIEKIYLYQSYMWLAYINLNQREVYKYARYWVDTFNSHPQMRVRDPDLYMRGLHYVLISTFSLRDHVRFNHFHKMLDRFHHRHEGTFNRTSRMLYFIYGANAKMNRFLLTGEYKKALTEVPAMESAIHRFRDQIDQHRSIVMHYKMAWLFFGIDKHESALEHLNKIIHERTKFLKDDVKSYARLLHLVIHVELDHYELAAYLIKSVERTFQRLGQNSRVTDLCFQHLKLLINQKGGPSSTDQWNQLYTALIHATSDRYENRSLIYFNFLDWAESRSVNTSIASIVRKRYLSKRT